MPVKDCLHLSKVCLRWLRNSKMSKFIISGKGQSDEMKKLIAHAERPGVKDNIVFTGYFPDKKLA